ncbi:MAG: mechanosensitive ion channel family protein [Chlamydiota bacterium]
MWEKFLDVSNFWLIEAVLVTIAAVGVNFILKFVFVRVEKMPPWKSGRLFKDFIIAAKSPIFYFIWLWLLFYLMNIAIVNTIDADFHLDIGVLMRAALLGIGCWALMRWKKIVAKRYVNRALQLQDEHHLHIIRIIEKLVTIAIVLITILMVLDLVGVQLATILAFGGMGGIAIGFAAKDVISNFFGGLMIYFTHPFTVGDRITSPDRNIEGIVERIGWYQTKLHTYDRQPVYVPNALFSTIIISNATRMYNRRVKETIGIRYDDYAKIKPIIAKIRNVLSDFEEIDYNQRVEVFFSGYGDFTLDIWVSFFTISIDRTTYLTVKQEALLAIGDIIEELGAEIAFPTTTTHIPNEIAVNATSQGPDILCNKD